MDDKVNRKRSIFQSNSSLLRGSTLCPASFRPFFTGVGDTRCKADALLGIPRWTVQVGLGGGCPLLKQKDKTRGLGPSSHLRFCGLVSYSGYRLLHRMNVLRLNIVGILDKGLKSENRTGRNLLL